ncbi:hypothetical protein QO018_001009 [Azospirillum picis]|uniref:Lipoprotein n=2 Tax=Azospirillum picis TaxID=488438 RepID=A0ABU0MFF5_9PROT|nr:hypothetical protein [Azospirillum picis]
MRAKLLLMAYATCSLLAACAGLQTGEGASGRAGDAPVGLTMQRDTGQSGGSAQLRSPDPASDGITNGWTS